MFALPKMNLDSQWQLSFTAYAPQSSPRLLTTPQLKRRSEVLIEAVIEGSRIGRAEVCLLMRHPLWEVEGEDMGLSNGGPSGDPTGKARSLLVEETCQCQRRVFLTVKWDR
jgi:hypothetical protein